MWAGSNAWRSPACARDDRLQAAFGGGLGIGEHAVGGAVGTDDPRLVRDAKLVQMANHDSLTGLFNRRRFVEELKKETITVMRDGHTSALLFIDLDNFKRINDSIGHGRGDRLLVETAKRLITELREDDVVTHVPGVARGVADALDAVDGRDVADQQREVGDVAVVHLAAVGVDVLAEQVDLAHALFCELYNLGYHVVERPADFLAARVGDDTETAVLAAALHHGDERGRALGARLREPVELLDLGEGHIDHRRRP